MPKKRPDGRYQRKITLSDGRSKIVYGRTLAELNAAADAVRDADRGGLTVDDRTTVAEWANLWLTTYKTTGLRANTVRMYESVVKLYILPVLGDLRIQDVRAVHARRVLSGAADRSASLQHKVLITMRQMFSEARRNQLILGDPTDGLKIVAQKAAPKKKHLTREESETLLSGLQDARAKAFVGLCLYAGLRKEEALGLQWGDIGPDRLEVRRAITFPGRNQPDEDMSLKTQASHRIVPLPEPLQRILAETPRLGLFVVPSADGGPMTAGGYRRLWSKVQTALPDVHVHAHMLRHTYATTLYYAGVDLRTAQQLLGHATIQMTANVYTHLAAEDSMAAVDAINGYYAPMYDKADDYN